MTATTATDRYDVEQEQGVLMALHLDSDCRICHVNDALSDFLGQCSPAIQGRELTSLLTDDTPRAIHHTLASVLSTDTPWTGHLKLAGNAGKSAWVKATLVPLTAESEPERFLLTLTPLPQTHHQVAEHAYLQLGRNKRQGSRNPFAKVSRFIHNQPIGRRITFLFTALTAMLAVMLVSNQLYTVDKITNRDAQHALAELARSVSASIDAESSRAASLATLVATLPQTIDAMDTLNRDGLSEMFLGTYKALSEQYGLRQFQFHTAPATSFLRLHKPEKFGDDLSSFRHTVVQANTAEETVRGLEQGRAGYGIRGVVPVLKAGKAIGTVEFGSSFNQYFFDQFKQTHQVDIGFFTLADGERQTIASTFSDATAISPARIQTAIADGAAYALPDIGDVPHSLYIAPMQDYSGNTVGVIAIAKDRTKTLADVAAMRNDIIAISMGVLLVTFVLSYLIARGISRPIQSVSTLAKNISEGKYDNTIALGREDEIGQLTKAMSAMQAKMAYDRHETLASAVTTARIKLALDYISANVTVSGPDGKLIFVNDAAITAFEQLAKKQSRAFSAASLLGNSLADFFNDDDISAFYARVLKKTETLFCKVWDHDFKLIVHPVYDDEGRYIARVTQWVDITNELVVQQEIKDIVNGANHGDLSGRIEMDDKSGFFADLAIEINSLIDCVDNVISDIDTAMKQVSSGDLTQPIVKDYTGTYASVKDSVNGTITHLESMVRELQAVSSGINRYAEQISGGNDELSRRTEQQAANLEETASSMEEITGTVKENANNAHAATTLAAEAQAVSSEGVSVIQNSIDAMSSINASSRKIEEIIGVIDEIAFQTNLLALNAAVEAARAGDQGKGFAVVASEVRDLASRSSDAAKQIKTLITDSVQHVSDGTGLVNNAGDTLNDIATSIGKVTTIINEIAYANQEQSRGIDMVSGAITQVDEATQQNAGLAEQNNAVALKLRKRSQDLNKVISTFAISPDAGQDSHGDEAFDIAV